MPHNIFDDMSQDFSQNDAILNFELPKNQSSIIKVIGVGGGGCNAVKHMYEQGIKGVDFIVCNTDAQSLDINPVPNKIQIGLKGLGAGSVPAVGRESALENIDKLKSAIEHNTEMVFITAGMGGGTGTGAAPVIAQIANEMGILTVGIVTIPFGFEGRKRRQYAEEGIKELKDSVDALLIICNDKLRELYGNLKMTEAFGKADDILTTAAKSIAELITCVGGINVDLEDVKTVMKGSGVAIMGSGIAEGENRAMNAVHTALNSPLLNDNNITGAKDILLYISFGEDEITMDEVMEISDYVIAEAGIDVNVIWGYGQDETLGKNISVTLIATGFESAGNDQISAPKIHNLEKTPQNNTKVVAETDLVNFTVSSQTSQEASKTVQEKPAPTIHNLFNDGEKSSFTVTDIAPTASETMEVKQVSSFNRQNQETPKEDSFQNNQTTMNDVERLSEMRKTNSQIKTNEGLGVIETIPAYKRKSFLMSDTNPTYENENPEFLMEIKQDNEVEIKRQNPFLHDNVD